MFKYFLGKILIFIKIININELRKVIRLITRRNNRIVKINIEKHNIE